MKIDDDDKNQKDIKKIENIDNNKIKEYFGERKLNYYGECDQNNQPSGVGRIITQRGS